MSSYCSNNVATSDNVSTAHRVYRQFEGTALQNAQPWWHLKKSPRPVFEFALWLPPFTEFAEGYVS
jgi:hypothetical protein